MVEYKGKMTRINITVPEDLLEDFRKYCDEQVRPLSAQLQFMMKKTLQENSVRQSRHYYDNENDE